MDRPEHHVLLACARVAADSERRAIIRDAVAAGLDWNYLLTTANAHGVTSLLHWCLDSACPDAVPAAVHNRMRKHFLGSAVENLRFGSQLLKVVDCLRTRGIDAIPFKGPALAEALYGNPAAREFVDLDLLVKKQEVPRAAIALKDLAYQPEKPISARQQRRILRRDYHLGLYANGAPAVELHWNLVSRYFALRVLDSNWWERSRPTPFHGGTIRQLSPEDLLVALAVHGCRHMWTSLAWLADVARLLARGSVDWTTVDRDHPLPDVQRMVSVALVLAHRTAGAALPERVLKRVESDSTAVALAEKSAGRLFDADHQGRTLGHLRMRSAFYHLRLKTTRRGRLQYSLRRTADVVGRILAP